jgi:hypothetical protein
VPPAFLGLEVGGQPVQRRQRAFESITHTTQLNRISQRKGWVLLNGDMRCNMLVIKKKSIY